MRRFLLRLRESRTAFWTGVALLVVNPPLGWAGFAVGGYFTARYGSPKYIFWATVLYGITWGMTGAGVLLAGPRGVTLARRILSRLWRGISGGDGEDVGTTHSRRG